MLAVVYRSLSVINFIVANIVIYIISISMSHRMYSDSQRVGRSGDRIPVSSKFSSPVQTGPGLTKPPM